MGDCDACWFGQDFEWISSPQSPAITTWKEGTELVRVSLVNSTDDCTGIDTGNDTLYFWKRESANDTHHVHSTMTGSRRGMPTDHGKRVTARFGCTKYIRYLKLLTGEDSYHNHLRDFSQIVACEQHSKTLWSPPFRHKILNTKHTSYFGINVNCNIENLLVCHTNGYHLTITNISLK